MPYYAVAHHGTAGLGNSFGYAELWEGDPPRSDMTTTVIGPLSQEEAGAEVGRMNAECEKFRDTQE